LQAGGKTIAVARPRSIASLYGRRGNPPRCGFIACGPVGSPARYNRQGDEISNRSGFFASEGKQQGPYRDSARELIADRTVPAATLVWTDGIAGWQKRGLWPTLLFALGCGLLIPIPWVLRWYTGWYVSQFGLVERTSYARRERSLALAK
jgi:hypothetical protein